MLENLVVAVESEAQVVDIVRVAGFMQKVSLVFFFPLTLIQSSSLIKIQIELQVRDGLI